MLNRQDRPVIFALLAVSLALILNVVSTAVSAQQPNHGKSDNQAAITSQERIIPPYETEVFWVFMGFVATCVIAGAAIFQIREARISSQRELRAYLSVVIWSGTYQERQKKYRFEAKPMILNNGATPAYKVRYSAVAKIIPDRIAVNYSFKIPAVPPVSQASIGPKENRVMSAIYPWTIPDRIASKVLDGDGISLWVWGIVKYEDAFGVGRETEFCQRLYWGHDGKGGRLVMGNYDARLGRST